MEKPSRFDKEILMKAIQYLNDETHDFHKRLRTLYRSQCKPRHLSPRITDHCDTEFLMLILNCKVTDNQKRIDYDPTSKAKIL